MDVATFAEIEDEFMARVRRIVWCTVATVDRAGRPRTRILHPIWEGTTGWIMTGPQSHKAKHLARNPYVSLSYWDQQHDIIYAECRAEWCNDIAEKRRVWELYKAAPPPLGYDPGMIWPSPDHDSFGLLRLEPWRIELAGMDLEKGGFHHIVWRA